MYSHVVYDIVDGDRGRAPARHPHPRGAQRAAGRRRATEFVSDYFDFSIYIDAEEDDIEQWYIERFLKLRETVFQDPDRSSGTTPISPTTRRSNRPRSIWREINGKNLRENIHRPRAGLVDRCTSRPTTASPVRLRRL